jgi:3-oxoacyl-[acyl-carrier-protein] synthase-3
MSHLLAFGHHLPDRIVTNPDLEARTGRAASTIEKSSGILERRYADEGTTVADLALAADLASRYGNVLVVAAEIMSRRITDADPDTAILFGDGAGAAIVSLGKGFAKIADISLSTDGNYADALQLQHNGSIQMKGLDVIIQASRKIPRSIEDLLTKNNLKPSDVGIFFMHQANVNLIRKVATALDVHEDRFFRNISYYGNTSSASLLIAASEWRAAHLSPPTTPIVLATFGAGFNWGSILLLPE